MQQTARCVGNRIGQSATLRRTVKGTYDPVAGTEGASTVTDHSISVKDIKLEKTNFNPELIETGDRLVGVPAGSLSITPDIETDTIVIGSEVWFIVQYQTKRIGETTLSYVFHMKR